MGTANNAFFSSFNPLSIFEKGTFSTVQHFRKGDYIFQLNESIDYLYYIQQGRVKIINYSEQGKELTRAIYHAEECFGELGLVGVERHRGFAVAMEDTTLQVASIGAMKQKMRENPGLQWFILQTIGARVVEMERRLESLTFRSSRSRIIEYLLHLVDKRGQRVGYEMLVRGFLTHQDIANMTATSRQTVTTILNELRSRNLLTFDRRRLLIRDVDKLRTEV
ncbi:MAG: Crp/Fnr family transcriptional regulator [Bacteroidota bacterium]